MRRLAVCCVAAIGVVGAMEVQPQAAAATAEGTTSCAGSVDSKGRYRSDKRGVIRSFYVRNASCAAARELLRPITRSTDDGYPGRNDSRLVVVRVPGGSVWKCRAAERLSRARKIAVATISCRPLTGRAGRRITARTKNFHDDLVTNGGGGSS